MEPVYWNIIDIDEVQKYLMDVSTTQHSIAVTEAAAWKREYPDRTFHVVKTTILEPHKRKEVGNERSDT